MLTPEEELNAIKLDAVWFALTDLAESVQEAIATLLPLVKANDAKSFVSLHDRLAA